MGLKVAHELARAVPLVEETGEAKVGRWKEQTTSYDEVKSCRGEGPGAGPARVGIRAAGGLVLSGPLAAAGERGWGWERGRSRRVLSAQKAQARSPIPWPAWGLQVLHPCGYLYGWQPCAWRREASVLVINGRRDHRTVRVDGEEGPGAWAVGSRRCSRLKSAEHTVVQRE